jgi:hypothetical protein
MSKIYDGGPAFPMPAHTGATGEQPRPIYGMSLRDWLAGQALANVPFDRITSPADAAAVGKWCYGMADSILNWQRRQP